MGAAKKIEKPNYHSIPDTEVQETHEYNVFVLDVRNRPIHHDKVNQFVREFKAGRFFMKEFPAIVNEDFVILDGQHRFEAVKLLSLPFYFRFTDKFSIQSIVTVQTNSGWETMDFVHAFIKQNKQDYVVLYRFMKRYGFPATTAAHLLTNNMKKSLVSQGFYEGNFQVHNEAKAHEYAKTIIQIQEMTQHKFVNKGFCMAVALVMQIDGFDKKRLLSQVAKYGTLLKHQVTIKEFMRNLEEVYNYHIPDKNRIRFI